MNVIPKSQRGGPLPNLLDKLNFLLEVWGKNPAFFPCFFPLFHRFSLFIPFPEKPLAGTYFISIFATKS